MKKYNIYARFEDGSTNEYHFSVLEKQQAISCYKNIKMRAVWCKFLSVDSDDPDIVYDLSDKY